jgi:hypothetical protein
MLPEIPKTTAKRSNVIALAKSLAVVNNIRKVSGSLAKFMVKWEKLEKQDVPPQALWT